MYRRASRQRRLAVRTGEVSLCAVPARQVAIAAHFTGTAGETRFAYAGPASDWVG